MTLYSDLLKVSRGHGLRVMRPDGPLLMPLGGALRYHIQGKLVGVVTGYVLLRAAFRQAGVVPKPAEVTIAAGHPGSGMLDAFEYFCRTVSGGRLTELGEQIGPVLPGAEGHFGWRITIAGTAMDLILRDGVLPSGLFKPPAPGENRGALQVSVSRDLLAARDDALFEISRGTPPGR